ncbi:hypothetical protein [Sphingobacterium sp. JUb56]|uniref:hypothetical protein n=1 Tax=Sphingobacterium sp. JUb56 TaxID=2587145 RepID=UPI00160762BC|nr:hypothetical protein [Sphingobacterium sp. JUb56]MBB2950102.1 putative transposase YdaD [Sphingobacterium sp. JUb56]
MIFVLKRKRDAEAVRMYQEGLEKQLKEAIRVSITAKAEVKAEGFAEGEYKKAMEKALRFKKMGLPMADIAKGTELSIEEIEKLK